MPAKSKEQIQHPFSRAGTHWAIISPADFDAVLFDMDGIVTKTASVHISAWKRAFDDFLKEKCGEDFKPFDSGEEYRVYVDGKPRFDGVNDFLASRNISLPYGKADDQAGMQSICALGNLKNRYFLSLVEEHGVEAFESTAAFIKEVKEQGLKVAIVTASRNGEQILKAANMLHIFDAKVDGIDREELKLRGKPAPDTFLEAAKRLGVKPERAIVVEDAISGVAAGRKGKFGMVIGVAREGKFRELIKNGADVAVADLADVRLGDETCARIPGMALAELDVSESNWVLSYDTYDPEIEGRREALCAIGNGYFATRAAAAESQADSNHYPGTYFAGVYNRLKFKSKGKEFEHEEIVNAPNWLPLTFKIEDGDWFSLDNCKILNYKQSLDLRRGLLNREIVFADDQGRECQLTEQRFAHMRHFHLACMKTEVTALNWSGRICLRWAIDGRIKNRGNKRFHHLDLKHLESLESKIENNVLYLQMRTRQSRIGIAEAVKCRLYLNEQEVEAERSEILEPEYIAQDLCLDLRKGDRLKVEKIVALYTSRDNAISEPGLAAFEAAKNAGHIRCS